MVIRTAAVEMGRKGDIQMQFRYTTDKIRYWLNAKNKEKRERKM